MSIKQNNKAKVFTLILAFIFCAIACASAPIFIISSVYSKKIKATENEWHKVRVADSSLYSDNGYIDYANKVFLDDVTYPDMKQM